MPARLLLALACLSVAPRALAQVSLGLEATVGAQRLGIERVPAAGEPLSAMGDLGATLLFRAGPVALGAAGEGNFVHGRLARFSASLLGGLAADLLPVLRLELLGEVGAANLRGEADLRSAAAGEWERFYGVRPGLSAKLPFFPLRAGVWGLARWGMPGVSGGPALGILGRLGIEF
jgi:hypothetical protein